MFRTSVHSRSGVECCAWRRSAHADATITGISGVTHILQQIESGDPAAAEQLLPLVYDELRKLAAARMAQEQPGQTLEATALVHEAYVRLVDTDRAQQWNSRGHFFAAARAKAWLPDAIDSEARTSRHGSGRRRFLQQQGAETGLDEMMIVGQRGG